MATVLAPQQNEFAFISSHLWRVSVDRYHEMINVGILTENDHLELLEGFLIEKMTVNPPHSFVTGNLREMLGRIVSDSHFVQSQQPLTTADSEPEPDVFVVIGNRRDFLDHHPYPEDVPLVIEVSEATLQQDRTLKKRIYARADIAVYWIVNLPESQVEVYTEPSGDSSEPTYHQLTIYRQGEEVPVVLNRVEIGRLLVKDLLP